MEAKPLSFEIKVGIFVFLGILLMFVIVFSIGKFYILKPMYDIKAVFGFANGIAIGAPVRLAGVNVGEIGDMQVYYDPQAQQTRVLLLARIKNGTKIEKNAVWKINTLGLLGEKYLEISPGTYDAGFLENGELIRGLDPIPMEEITKTMKELSDNARAITESANVILKRLEKGEGTIGKLLTEEEVYNDLRDFVKDIKAHPWKLLVKERERPEEKVIPASRGAETKKGVNR